jgi:hypothetical protein
VFIQHGLLEGRTEYTLTRQLVVFAIQNLWEISEKLADWIGPALREVSERVWVEGSIRCLCAY